MPDSAPAADAALRTQLLLLNVLIIATCGLVYELVAGTLASYVLGDSVTQFSICIGMYLSALGVGAWLSGFIDKGAARVFIEVEYGVALLGGISAPLLFIGFSYVEHFRLLLYGLVFGIGTLVGLELPLLMRILKDELGFKELVARVLAFDYIGALAGSLLFPIFLVPQLGLVRTSLVFGMLNGVVGIWGTWILRPLLTENVLLLRLRGVVITAILAAGVIQADELSTFAERKLYPDEILYATQSKYQRIVVTGHQKGFSLYLNGKLQLDSIDEYRYHEALVHPAFAATNSPRRVLVLGGGDGLALREILKLRSVESVTLVDLDPAMTSLAENFPPLAALNAHAFADPRVKVVNEDAFLWIDSAEEQFDVVVIDFPDPNNFSLGKLYTSRFYRMLARRLAPGGAIGVQSTSPLFARKSYWCIIATLEAAGFEVKPYHAAVPSFGVWGFAIAKREPFETPTEIPEEFAARFLNDETLAAMFATPEDLARVEVEVNRLNNQSLVRYYENE